MTRRTPDKDTIIKLRGEGLTFKKIGQRYGVTSRAIFWALHQTPKYSTTETCHIPQHVIDYWRTEWGWSNEQIIEKVRLYNQSLVRR